MTHVPWHTVEEDDIQELQGVDSVELLSVGIDIGTTTTHLMFSELLAKQQGNEHSSKFEIIKKEPVYKSEVSLTPYKNETTIDTDAVDEFVTQCYSESGYSPADVDTGAVIVTGEASRKKNADRIADLFSKKAGEFVCATAGPNLEALMSAHGSGAVDLSSEQKVSVLHVDIGGGTTKLAYIVDGFVKETSSINVGARLIEFDEKGNVSRLENAARKVADHIDVTVNMGAPVEESNRQKIAQKFTELLFKVIDGDLSPLARDLLVTDSPEQIPFELLTFSGGGSEYVYDRSTEYHNDLGPELGAAINEALQARDAAVTELDSGIRATVLGSTQHNVQISGSTLTITDEEILPLRNVPLIPFVVESDVQAKGLQELIQEKLERYDVNASNDVCALGFHLHAIPTRDVLRTITSAARSVISLNSEKEPLILVFDSDIALNAGEHAKKQTDQPVISIDSIELEQFGYIDIGEPIELTNAVPVTVKSLIFEG